MDMSNISEDSYDFTAYKSTPTNSKVNLVESDSPTSNPSTNPTTPSKLNNFQIHQQIWSRIFSEKQYSKDLKRYNGSENHGIKAKENWAAIISAVRYSFI